MSDILKTCITIDRNFTKQLFLHKQLKNMMGMFLKNYCLQIANALCFVAFLMGGSSAAIAQQTTYLKTSSPSPETVYKISEKSPEPCGGLVTFYEYTEDNIKKTEEAKKKGIRGNVFVQFIVEKDGKLSNIKVIKGIGAGCDEAVVDCLKNAPKWTPGKQNGTCVRVQKTMSIQVR